MKRLQLVFPLLILALATTTSVFAQSSNEGPPSNTVDQIMSEIRTQLNLGPNDRIDPRQVPSALMVRLGDAVMDIMVPNERQHQYMDEMMGGEGSQSLDAMHEWIAYRYLSGGYNRGRRGYGMMGGGMMGYGYDRWGMMGNPAVPYQNNEYRSPEEIARTRYSEGKITRTEYERILRDLRQPSASRRQ